MVKSSPYKSTARTRALRKRRKNGKISIRSEFDEDALVECLQAVGVLDPNLSDDLGAIACALPKLIELLNCPPVLAAIDGTRSKVTD